MNTETDGSLRDMLKRALQHADDAERLATTTAHRNDLLQQRMDHFEEMDKERRVTTSATLARIEEGVAGLYKRGWNFALTITGGLFAAAGIIAGVAYWLGQTIGKVPTVH